jgi:hypothetical protein
MARGIVAAALLAAGGLVCCQQIIGIEERTAEPTVHCADGSCVCRAPLVDCDGDLSNGCEDLQIDLENCGTCGARCGGSCVEGRCQANVVLSTPSGSIGRFALDGDSLYAGDCTDIFRISRDDLSREIVASNPPCCSNVRRAGSWLYWTACQDINYAKPDGSAAGTAANGQHHIADLVVDDTDIYWVETDLADPFESTLWRTSLSGGAPVSMGDLANDFFGAIEIHQGKLYALTDGLTDPPLFREFDLADGSANDIPLDAPTGPSIAFDADHVYWGDQDGVVWRRALVEPRRARAARGR